MYSGEYFSEFAIGVALRNLMKANKVGRVTEYPGGLTYYFLTPDTVRLQVAKAQIKPCMSKPRSNPASFVRPSIAFG